MKRSLLALISIACFVALGPSLIQCADNPTYPKIIPCVQPPDPSTVVYIAGEQTRTDQAGRSTNYAAYWKNNQVTLLTDSTENAHAYAIAVNGSDVHVVGVVAPLAVYWKNGKATALSGGISTAVAVALSGDDVYIAGSVFENHRILAVYWKNGIRVTLSDSIHSDQTTAIAVVGNDIYVAGNHTVNGSSIAAYWKNGDLTLLNDTTDIIATTTSIFVSGSDVYVAGQEIIYGGTTPLRIATYWKNGNRVLLGNGIPDSGAQSIFVKDNRVYVVGYERNSVISNSLSKYWVDGYSITLSENIGKYISYAVATSIIITGENIHVALQQNDPGTNTSSAQYWKDGCAVDIADDGATSTELGGMFIVK